MQIEFLQDAVKSWLSRVAETQHNLQTLRNEKEALAKENADLELRLEESDSANELLKDKNATVFRGDGCGHKRP